MVRSACHLGHPLLDGNARCRPIELIQDVQYNLVHNAVECFQGCENSLNISETTVHVTPHVLIRILVISKVANFCLLWQSQLSLRATYDSLRSDNPML